MHLFLVALALPTCLFLNFLAIGYRWVDYRWKDGRGMIQSVKPNESSNRRIAIKSSRRYATPGDLSSSLCPPSDSSSTTVRYPLRISGTTLSREVFSLFLWVVSSSDVRRGLDQVPLNSMHMHVPNVNGYGVAVALALLVDSVSRLSVFSFVVHNIQSCFVFDWDLVVGPNGPGNKIPSMPYHTAPSTRPHGADSDPDIQTTPLRYRAPYIPICMALNVFRVVCGGRVRSNHPPLFSSSSSS